MKKEFVFCEACGTSSLDEDARMLCAIANDCGAVAVMIWNRVPTYARPGEEAEVVKMRLQLHGILGLRLPRPEDLP